MCFIQNQLNKQIIARPKFFLFCFVWIRFQAYRYVLKIILSQIDLQHFKVCHCIPSHPVGRTGDDIILICSLVEALLTPRKKITSAMVCTWNVIGPLVPLSLKLLLLCYFHNILNSSILEPFTTVFIKHFSRSPRFTKYFPQKNFYLKYFRIFTINKKNTPKLTY